MNNTDFSEFTEDLDFGTLTPEEMDSLSDWHETEDSTILDAMKELTSDIRGQSHRGRSVMHVDMTDNEANRYLMRRLDLSSRQVQLLACILYYYQMKGNPCDSEDMVTALGMHPFDVMGLSDDVLALAEKGYVYPANIKSDGGCGRWGMTRKGLKALAENRALDAASLRVKDSLAFLAECADLIEACMFGNGRDLELLIGWLMRFNGHLPIVHNLQRICGNDNETLKALVYMATQHAIYGSSRVACSELDNVMSSLDMRRITFGFEEGTHMLVREGLVEPYCSNGFASTKEWCISRKGWTELVTPNTAEVDLLVNKKEKANSRLLSHDQITARALFFSGGTEQEVNRLRAMLQDDNYRALLERLEANNMPTGINILLYGTPGTGKTELVQQLARETGRDLMVVDMTRIRDKWVGGSEQNLANIFKSYRDSVACSKKAPILFCNECDAIFGSRLESTRDSVDKMENALQNILLEQMEQMEGIMICTTNLTSSLDKAFERRFLVKLQLPKPNLQARKQIWHEMMPSLTDEQRTILAEKYAFSGGQIQNVVRRHIINGIVMGDEGVDFASILADCNAETMDRSNGRRVGF
jgi:hypothetical protein